MYHCDNCYKINSLFISDGTSSSLTQFVAELIPRNTAAPIRLMQAKQGAVAQATVECTSAMNNLMWQAIKTGFLIFVG